MLKTIISGLVATAVVLGAMSASAEQAKEGQTLQPAKIVVYRAEEATRTQQVKFQVQLDQRSLGRLKYDDMVVSEVAPGTYQLGTSLNGGEVLEIQVQPGQTYYVYSQLRALGDRVTPQLMVVEQQVAVEQQPAIERNI